MNSSALPAQGGPGLPHLVRRVCLGPSQPAGRFVLLTNLLHFGPTTIAAIYKDRWEIELFFKALKQNLKVKSFVGTSQNALLDSDLDSADRYAAVEMDAPSLQGEVVPSPIWLPCCV